MKETFLRIPIGEITPSPTNPRKRFDEGKLAELAASIKAQGIVQPVVVRPVEADGPRFELVAGERRLRAAAMAELAEIPAIVRELTDADVLEIQVLENSQREDVHPLEECQGFKRILDAGLYGTGLPAVEQLAGKLGKSTSYVYQRLKLAELTEEAQKEFLDGAITAGHAILIARLQPVDQARCLSFLLEEKLWDNGRYVLARTTSEVRGVRRLAEWIGGNITRKLAAAPWKLKDATLLPQAGACSACAKRTGAEGKLFEEEDKSDRCLDGKCFEAKLSAHRARTIEQAKAAHPEAELAQITYGGRGVAGAKRFSRWDTHAKPTGGMVPIIVVEADDAALIGTVRYVDPNAAAGAKEQQAKDPEERKKRLEELRLQRVENLTRQRVYESCIEAIERGYGEGMLGGSMAQVVLLKALQVHTDTVLSGPAHRGPDGEGLLRPFGLTPYGRQAKADDHLRMPAPGSIEMAKLALGMCVRDEIAYGDVQKPSGWALFAFAEALQIDVGRVRKIADFECLSKKQQVERLSDLRAKARPDKDLIAQLESRSPAKAKQEVAA